MQPPKTAYSGSVSPTEISDFDISRIAQGVIIQAAKEAAAGSPDARQWLSEPETAATWFVAAGLSERHVIQWIESGCNLPARTLSKNQPNPKGKTHDRDTLRTETKTTKGRISP